VRKKDIQCAIKNVKNGKAAASDKIAPEMIKYGGEEMLELGTTNKTLQQCVDTGKGAKGMEGWYHSTSTKVGRGKGSTQTREASPYYQIQGKSWSQLY